eukprot:Amastigsp_a509040_483.p4 type:complete len:111 gc:universal Amastigsp_a509040_483:309-641(+)
MWRNSSICPSAAAAASVPFFGATGTKRYSARAPSWVMHHGTLYLAKMASTERVSSVASWTMCSKALSVKTFSRTARAAAIESALPARVPPMPPTSTRSASRKALMRCAIS